MTLDLNHLRQWVGNQQEQVDLVTLTPMTAMAATLDRTGAQFAIGSVLPPLWHWLYFLPLTPQSELGADGHPLKGSFMPPISLPRRMWAGSRITFAHDLQAGQSIKRRSTIKSVHAKSGRSGELAFVCVQHGIENAGGVAILEEHDIVFRENPATGIPQQPLPPGDRHPQTAAFSKQISPDPVFLFRYSALTFNGHRIHYDRRYVTKVEGYPGLIVHGPLLATLIVELLQENLDQVRLTYFEFRALRPVFDTNTFTVCGRQTSASTVDLWVQDHEGFLCMKAEAHIAAT